MISVGTLIAYILVCSGVVILRYEGILEKYKLQNAEQSDKYDNLLTNNLPILVSAYAILCICVGFILVETSAEDEYFWLLVAVSTTVFVDLYLKNAIVKEQNNVFLCPLCPYIPCLGIF